MEPEGRLGHFDMEAFYGSVDNERRTRGLTWKRVAEEAGVSASSLSRMARGKRPDVDTFAALAAWAQLDTNMFVAGGKGSSGDRLVPSTIAAQLYRDPQLTRQAAATLTDIFTVSYSRLARDRSTRSRKTKP